MKIHPILVFTVIVLWLAPFAWAMPPQSPAAQQFGFDLMERFDDIQNWQGKVRSGQSARTMTSDDFPKRLDGSSTPFNFYDYWVATDPGDDWIKDHRSNGGYIWDPQNSGQGKSLCLDLSHRGDNKLATGKNFGPSRFGTYFGDGTRTSGYDEMYVFFMLRFPRSLFPTSVDSSKVGTYKAGSSLLYGGIKFMTMAHGFIRPWLHADGEGSGSSKEYYGAKRTYGWHPNVTYLLGHKGDTDMMTSFYDYHNLPSDGSGPRSPCESQHHNSLSEYANVPIPSDQWIGVEIYYKLNTPGKEDGVMKIWYYLTDGTEFKVWEKTSHWMQATCLKDDKMNLFFIGGNNSDNWRWGPTMEPRFYVDDFIIHHDRIAPKYFSKIKGKLPPPPVNLRVGE